MLSLTTSSPATQALTTTGLPTGSGPSKAALVLGPARRLAPSTTTLPHQRLGTDRPSGGPTAPLCGPGHLVIVARRARSELDRLIVGTAPQRRLLARLHPDGRWWRWRYCLGG